MSFYLHDPTGDTVKTQSAHERILENHVGKRVGFIFNMHTSAIAFWQTLESEVDRLFKPVAMQRIYKENTWAPAADSEVDRLVRETDYILVGVGA